MPNHQPVTALLVDQPCRRDRHSRGADARGKQARPTPIRPAMAPAAGPARAAKGLQRPTVARLFWAQPPAPPGNKLALGIGGLAPAQA